MAGYCSAMTASKAGSELQGDGGNLTFRLQMHVTCSKIFNRASPAMLLSNAPCA